MSNHNVDGCLLRIGVDRMTEDMFGRFVFVMAGGEIRLDRVDNGGRRNRAVDLSVSVEQETLACRRKPGRSL